MLIDAKAAGEILGVPASWVLREARADRIPHVRLGRYVRFDPDALQAWIQTRRRGPTAAASNPHPLAAMVEFQGKKQQYP